MELWITNKKHLGELNYKSPRSLPIVDNIVGGICISVLCTNFCSKCHLFSIFLHYLGIEYVQFDTNKLLTLLCCEQN